MRRAVPEIELFGWNYGDPIPWDQIEKAAVVTLVDVSFPVDDMRRLLKLRPAAVWIDHHKSAIEEMKSAGLKFRGFQETEKAACELAWLWTTATEDLPRAVWLLGRWDTWQWIGDEARDEIEAFQFGMRSIETDPRKNPSIWDNLLDAVHNVEWRFIIASKGHAILSYRDQQNAIVAKGAFETTLDGHRVLALNAGGGSTIFDSIWSDHPDCVAMLAFVWRRDKWSVSLYSDRDFDCSVACQAHGGGGHKGAAGFNCETLPFELKP